MEFGSLRMESQMEINAGIPENYCQGEAAHLELVDLEDIQLPFEDKPRRVRIKSVKVTRGRKNK